MSDNPWNFLFGQRPAVRTVDAATALPGRTAAVLPHPQPHTVLGTPIVAPWPAGFERIYLALGCFWGAEKMFWETAGVYTTAVGYQGGYTTNPTYEEVCSGLTGHAEVVLVVFDPAVIDAAAILRTFWEAHDPTQGFRQGNDVGTQYRSAIYTTTDQQLDLANQTRDLYAARLADAGYGDITTELLPAAQVSPFYYAEDYHQQYLQKNPNGYCPLHSTGVACR